MKLIYRISIGVLAVMILVAPCLQPIYAAAEISPQSVAAQNNTENDIVPFAADTPTTHKNLDGGSYRAQIVELASDRATNAARYFSTLSGGITVTYYLSSCGTAASTARSMKIQLYERVSDTSSWVLVDTHPVSFDSNGSGIAFFYDVDPDAFYYVSFRNTSSFTSWSGMDINGYADIEPANLRAKEMSSR